MTPEEQEVLAKARHLGHNLIKEPSANASEVFYRCDKCRLTAFFNYETNGAGVSWGLTNYTCTKAEEGMRDLHPNLFK